MKCPACGSGDYETELEKDAGRWQALLMKISGLRCAEDGSTAFRFPWVPTLPGADIMRGSVAQHFVAAFDAAHGIKEQP